MMKLRSRISLDRISALPEPIIHHILSRLPTKSVKLASSLSKTWYGFCSSFPYLDFNVISFGTRKTVRKRYLNYIGETLRRFHERNSGTLIRRVRISINLINSRWVSILDNCIRLALNHGVEKIDLKLLGICYELPLRAVFASNSIRVIKLHQCNLLKTFHHGDISISCSKLRKLNIRGFYFDDITLRYVISNCPLMEELEIDDAMGITNICISRLHKLKSLRLTNLSSLTKFKISNDSLNKLAIIKCRQIVELEIDAPNLLSFEFESDSVPLVAPMHTIMDHSYITIDIDLKPSLYDNFVVNFRNFVSRLNRVNYLRIGLYYFDMISVDELEERVVQSLTNIQELKIIVDTTESFQDSVDCYGEVILVFRP